MIELIKREVPFIGNPNDDLTPELIDDIVQGRLKAEDNCNCSNDNGITQHILEIMKSCVSFNPNQRMKFVEIQKIMRKMDKSISNSGKSNIVDNMVIKLEKYSSKLEEIVDEKTQALEEEKKKSDALLYRMLPG